MVTILVTLQKVHSVKSLDEQWFTSRTSTTNSAPTTSVIEHKNFICWTSYRFEILASVIIVLFLITKCSNVCKKLKDLSHNGFHLAIEINDNRNRSMIVRLDHFSENVQSYHICCNESIHSICMNGILRPILRINWNVKILNQNLPFGWTTLKGMYRLDHLQAFRLRKMLRNQFTTYWVTLQH